MRIAVLLAGSLLAATACASENSEREVPTSGSAASDHSAADVAFAADMSAHHSQALLMVLMAQGRPQTPAFTELLRDIHAAQSPEIVQLTRWLELWGEKPPEHLHGETGTEADSASGADSGHAGMLSPDELRALRETPDADFEAAWLRAMIFHHEGAIEMAQAELAEGTHEEARALAEEIVTSQTAEITRMQAMLAS